MSGWWADIFAPGAEAEGARLDAALDAQNKRLLDKGLISTADYQSRAERLNQTSATHYDEQIAESFQDGAKEGYQNVTGAIKDTLKAPFQFAWDSIPWIVWLVLALALFWWLGGLVWLKGRLAK